MSRGDRRFGFIGAASFAMGIRISTVGAADGAATLLAFVDVPVVLGVAGRVLGGAGIVDDAVAWRVATSANANCL